MGKKQKKPEQPSWVADVLREIGVRAPHPQIKAKAVRKAARKARVPVTTLRAMTPEPSDVSGLVLPRTWSDVLSGLTSEQLQFVAEHERKHAELRNQALFNTATDAVIGKYLQEQGFVSPPDKDYLRHEALDRCSLLAAQVEEWLLEHPAIQANAEWREKVGQAAALLHEVYQAIGAGPRSASSSRC